LADETLSFEEHRKRREANASTVRCAKCAKWIVATATRCPECGVHFQGEAQDFADPANETTSHGTPKWVLVLAALLVVAMFIGAISWK